MRWVVTGGAGFVGSNIIAALERNGLGPIVVVDALEGEKWLNISKRSLYAIVAPRDIWTYLDACPEETAVIHMGARTSTTDDDADALVETNIMLTIKLFELCAERGWPFIFASSAATYGTDRLQSDSEADLPLLQPRTTYGWSKRIADASVTMRAAEKAPPLWAGLRFFNVYGCGEDHKGDQRSFVSKCFEAIRQGKPIRLWRGSENFKRDWVAVEDCADLVVRILTDQAAPIRSGVFNVGTGMATSFADVASICIGEAGKIAPVETVAFPTALYGRYQSFTKADTARLMALMPDLQFRDLRSGARRYWQEHASRDDLSRFP